jgi:hypothetical protein
VANAARVGRQLIGAMDAGSSGKVALSSSSV